MTAHPRDFAWSARSVSVLFHGLVLVLVTRMTAPVAPAGHPVLPRFEWQFPALALSPRTTGTGPTGSGSTGVAPAPVFESVDPVGELGPIPLAGPLRRVGISLSTARDSSRLVTTSNLTGTDEGAEFPLLLGTGSPGYPATAPARGLGSVDSVVVEYLISADGRVGRESIRSVAASDPAFVRAVSEFLVAARYRPGTRNGSATPVLARQLFRFVRR